MQNYSKMINKFIKDKNVICIYEYGSTVYGVNNKKSDLDYILVVTDNYNNYIDNIYDNNCHYNLYKESDWLNMIKQNQITVLECIFCENKYKIKENKNYDIIINQIELRKSISKVCSNSYDKCRKKLTIEKDFSPRIAKKSLWHSLRILHFGIQCAKYGKIINFQECNCYYEEIVNNPINDWKYYEKNWKSFFNNKRSEFRLYSEKEWREYRK